ncbi:MAG: nuclear transport factor 2 family protein [Bacillota bacterium]|nr:nuclear transport factor 2 family protein [Bacillota bacterium]
MEKEQGIKKYFAALQKGSYDEIMQLFTPDAIINSPLYGTVTASVFYDGLFKDTSKSTITLLNIFNGTDNSFNSAGHFRYDWVMRDGTPVSFECVDIFYFSEDGLIKELSIIYDTFNTTRSAFENLK